MSIREIYFARELDAAWIIALWKAIHGGDGGPEQTPAQAIAALAQYVARPAQTTFSFDELHAQFAKLGVQVTERAEESAKLAAKTELAIEDQDRNRVAHRYCFKFKGETICIQLPVLTHLPTAA